MAIAQPLSREDAARRQRFWRFIESVLAVQTARRGRPFTQQDLAQACGISPGTISKYRTMQIDPLFAGAVVVSTMAELGGVSVSAVLRHVQTGEPLVAETEGPQGSLAGLATMEGPQLAAALRVIASAVERQQAVAEPVEAGPPAWWRSVVEAWFAELPPGVAQRMLVLAQVDEEEFRSGEAIEIAPESVAQLLGVEQEELARRWKAETS